MPCNAEYLEPTAKERELQRTARLILYVDQQMKQPSPGWIQKMAMDRYASDDTVVTVLCDMLQFMSDDERERIVYNAHDPLARDLADWWETHLAADEARLAAEAEAEAAATRRDAALAKLSPEDRRVLGLDR